MKLLVHICCAPCATYPFKKLEDDGHELIGFWYNPNIHPYSEYARRLDSVQLFQELHDLQVLFRDDYGLEEFLEAVKDDKTYRIRCRRCYRMRFEAAAREASRQRIDSFTTTLLVSPYQDHELIIEEGERAAELSGVDFFHEDLRSGYREGRRMARDAGFYMQKYCGCIFSEMERYRGANTRKPAGRKKENRPLRGSHHR